VGGFDHFCSCDARGEEEQETEDAEVSHAPFDAREVESLQGRQMCFSRAAAS
jgi:hypothetical protein